jgi:hypothetical protein
MVYPLRQRRMHLSCLSHDRGNQNSSHPRSQGMTYPSVLYAPNREQCFPAKVSPEPREEREKSWNK